MADQLLYEFFKPERWDAAIQTGLDKDISKSLLKQIVTQEYRIQWYRDIRDRNYQIQPPHEARIPKEDGTYRTVYANTEKDRILLTILNNLLFESCSDMIHPSCKSYQTGIGCGKIVQQVSRTLQTLQGPDIGYKIDLSKYFDSVKITDILSIFDAIESRTGQSVLIDILRTYYLDNTVIDLKHNTIQKYTSLKQGCAVAAFLADAVLYEIDDTMSQLPVTYVRYSDDILILGQKSDTEYAFQKLNQMLDAMSLNINSKKTEHLQKDTWFKFLGFTLKDNQISLSKNRIKTFESEIRKRTIQTKTNNYSVILHAVQQYLYQGTYSWATSVLPIINNQKDIQTLNAFTMDAIRAGVTGKTHIGGLGTVTDKPDHTILRGKGRNVSMNRTKLPMLENYHTLSNMQDILLANRACYNTIANTL